MMQNTEMLEVSYLNSYIALTQRVRSEFGEQTFLESRGILTEVMEDNKLFSLINKESLSRISLESHLNDPSIEGKINSFGELCYARTGRIYFFDNKTSIPSSNSRFFFFLIICLNNFSDDRVMPFLQHQQSINKEEKKVFLKSLEINVLEYKSKYISNSKADLVLNWILSKSKSIGSTGDVTPDTNQTLADIWEGTDEEYQAVIALLKNVNPHLASPFVTEIKDKLNWNQTPQKGWVQYLAAFIRTLIEKKWIADQYSAPRLISLLDPTFNIGSIDSKPFKSISSRHFDSKYLIPFQGIPNNDVA